MLRLATLAAVVAVLGAAWPVLFNEGSAMGKLLIRTYEVEAAGDAEFEAEMESQLFGETKNSDKVGDTRNAGESKAVEVIQSKSASGDTGGYVSRVRQLDKGVAVVCLLIVVGVAIGYQRWPRVAWLYLLPGIWILANGQAIATFEAPKSDDKKQAAASK